MFAGPGVKSGGGVEHRLLGYRQALDAAGIAFDPALVLGCRFETDEMMKLGRQIAELSDVTAVFATADLLAAGIMAGLQQSGKRIPEDISVVGFDDINWSRMTNPMLTTVRQDADEKGRLADQFMISLREGKMPEKPQIILPVQLMERDSVRDISGSDKLL